MKCLFLIALFMDDKAMRKLIDNRKVPEQDVSQKMTIDSKCSAKWLFVDMETADVWQYTDTFKSAGLKNIKTLEKIVKFWLQTQN